MSAKNAQRRSARQEHAPYRCTQCSLWHAAAHFASKHQNPRWSMYRVCLSCDAKKQCFFGQAKQTKEYFSHAAWQTRDPKRRLCLQCQAKTRGTWKCAVCHQRRSRSQFANFISTRPSGEDGTQICDTCHAAKLQHAVRKRAAASSAARLEPLRKRFRHRGIIRETWEAIAANKNARTRDQSNPFDMRAADLASSVLQQWKKNNHPASTCNNPSGVRIHLSFLQRRCDIVCCYWTD